MQNSLLETLVGAVVILVSAAFLKVGYRMTSVIPSKDGATYFGVFDSIDGIAPNSEVKIGGVRVGAVGDIHFDTQYRVVVEIRLRKGVRVPEDSSLAITSSGLMGDPYVDLVPGSSEDDLEEGGTFLVAKSPTTLESIINKVVLALGSKNEPQKTTN